MTDEQQYGDLYEPVILTGIPFNRKFILHCPVISKLLLLRIVFLFIVSSFVACSKNSKSVEPVQDITIPPPVLKPVLITVSPQIGGYYEAVPADYSSTVNPLPLILFIHGAGHYGNGRIDLPMLLSDAIPQLLDEKRLPGKFTINKTDFSFIYLMPQFSKAPSPLEIMSFIEYARSGYRIDDKRIYLVGLSIGGTAVINFTAKFPETVAGFVAMSGVLKNDPDFKSKCKTLAVKKVAAWVFHNNNDQIIPVTDAKLFVEELIKQQAVIQPRLTLLEPTGIENHDSWTRATDPLYKEDNMNIYEWMLQNSK